MPSENVRGACHVSTASWTAATEARSAIKHRQKAMEVADFCIHFPVRAPADYPRARRKYTRNGRKSVQLIVRVCRWSRRLPPHPPERCFRSTAAVRAGEGMNFMHDRHGIRRGCIVLAE